LFLVGRRLCGLVLCFVGLFSIKNEYEKTKTDMVDEKKCYFCGAHPRGKGFRGAAGLDSSRCPAFFFVFGCIKNRNMRNRFSGPTLDFWK
jgi:hypothetical protein